MKKIIVATALCCVAFSGYSQKILAPSLTVTVRDEAGNLIPNAVAKLYENEKDYKKEVNSVQATTTNDKGIARFKDLKEIPYFIWVSKDDRNNAGGGEKIEQLQKAKFNKVTIIIQ